MPFFKTLIYAGVIVTTSLSFASGPDFTKINRTIAESLDSVVRESQVFTKLNYEIDAKRTDLENDRYGVNLDATLKQAPWSQQEVPLSATLDLTRRAEGKQGMAVTITSTISSDPLAFMKFITSKHQCPPRPSVQGVLRVLKNEDCHIAAQMKGATSLDDLYEILKKHVLDSKLAVQQYRNSIETVLPTVRQSALKQLLSEQSESSRKIIEDLNVTTIRKDDSGFGIRASMFRFGELLEMKKFELSLSPDSVKLALSIETPFGSRLYDAAKSDILKLISDMEEGKEYTKALIQLEARIWLQLIQMWGNPSF